MQTLFGARLEQHALNDRVSPALAMAGREIGYPELVARVRNCAAWLRRERCTSSEVIGISIAEEIPHLVASLALLSLGVPYACLPTQDPLAAKLSLAERLGVRRTVVTDPQRGLPGRETLVLTLDRCEAAGPEAAPESIDADPDAPAVYVASSGTTGAPKVFALSQRALARRAESLGRSEGMGPGSRALTLLPVENFLAQNRLLRCAYLGSTGILQVGSPPSLSVQELCARLDVTLIEMSVLHASSLVADPQARPFPLRTTIFTAGSPVPSALRRKFESRFGVPLFVHYGAREFGRITTTYPHGGGSFDTVGRPLPSVDLQIVDGDGKALPPGEVGEVRVRGPCMTRAYHSDPQASGRHFKDGWFYPQDLGSLTPSGALCLHGRVDDMMNLDGIKIFPADIERVLEEHPAVESAAAFAKASAAHGDIPVAAVVLHASASVEIDELMARARERLGVRAPRKIFVLDALPRNAAGKIVKQELSELLARDA
jgi:acyl-CoA synthetase (AMP-forming)/AMP-acid ligase II